MSTSVVDRMAVSGLWELGFHGQGVTVAVIDTGMTPQSDFAPNIVEDLDFTGESRARDAANVHGTQVADCVHAVASQASIANLRVVPAKSVFTRESVIRAIRHCIEVYPKYRVLNISLSFNPAGCPDQCALCQAVDQAYAKGMLVVVAAGNTGPKPDTLTCPARARWAIANVATWTRAEAEYWEEHWMRRMWYTHVTGDMGKRYGTSFSAGYTSGAAALLFSAFPELDADTLRFSMIHVAGQMRTEKGHETTLQFDRVHSHLLWMRQMVSVGAMVTKPGALRPLVPSF